jgi:recombination protein RecR
MDNNISSQLLAEAVNEFATLPGVGKKTALRFALHLLRQEDKYFFSFTEALNNMKKHIKYCKQCHNISDTEICNICANENRDKSTVCVVENIQNVIAIENTNNFGGYYHVLGGVISPMDGIGPSDLTIDSLINKVSSGEVNEIILALNTTMEGDATNFFIYKKLKELNVKISILARGVSIGDDLEYTDDVTLGQSIVNRTNFENTLK